MSDGSRNMEGNYKPKKRYPSSLIATMKRFTKIDRDVYIIYLIRLVRDIRPGRPLESTCIDAVDLWDKRVDKVQSFVCCSEDDARDALLHAHFSEQEAIDILRRDEEGIYDKPKKIAPSVKKLLKRVTKIESDEDIVRLFIMGGGRSDVVIKIWNERIQKVQRRIPCSEDDARAALIEANLSCYGAIKIIKEKWLDLLMDHSSDKFNITLTFTKAHQLLHNKEWDLQKTITHYNKKMEETQNMKITRFEEQCQKTVRRSVVVRYLKRANWDVNRAIEHWNINNHCSMCYEEYDDENGSRRVIKDKHCTNNECSVMCCRECSEKCFLNNIRKCPFCQVGLQIYKAREGEE